MWFSRKLGTKVKFWPCANYAWELMGSVFDEELQLLHMESFILKVLTIVTMPQQNLVVYCWKKMVFIIMRAYKVV